MNRLDCTSCGARVEVPADFGKAKLRCDACGYYVPVPEKLRNQVPATPEPVQDAVNERPLKSAVPAYAKTKKPLPEVAPLVSGSEDEDDGLPYTVPGDAIQKCTACGKDLPLGAEFCVHCGVNFATRKKKKKRYEAVSKFWDPRWTLEERLKAFGLCVVIDILVAVFFLESFGVIQILLQAFIIGTFEKLTVTRTEKGVCTITKQWRYAFIPVNPITLDHKQSQGVGIVATQHAGLLEWFTFIYLLILVIVPGLLFYWFVMRPDRFNVSLCDVHGSTNDIAFRTTSREQAEEICQTISDCAKLWYKPVL